MGEERRILLSNGALELCLGVITHLPVGVHLYRLDPTAVWCSRGRTRPPTASSGSTTAVRRQTIEEAFPPLAATEVPARYRARRRTA